MPTIKIIFKWLKWSNGQNTQVVNIWVNKDGYWSKRSQRALIKALKDMKGITVEEA